MAESALPRSDDAPAAASPPPKDRRSIRQVALAAVAALLCAAMLAGPAYAEPAVPTSPGVSADDPCRNIGPTIRESGGAAPKPSQERQLIRGSEKFGLDGILRKGAQFLKIDGDLPQDDLVPPVRLLDPNLQGEGTYNSKTQLKSGIVCSIVDSLVKRKIRRDIAQKVALGLFATPTLLAGVEGPDVASLVQNGVACGVELAKAAAAAAAAGGSAGAAAAAAAPTAISAGPVCVAAGGDAARIAGKVINVWEHNPYFPQVVEFAAVLDPDTEIGAEVWNKIPQQLRFSELKGAMKALSRFNLKLSEVWIGKSIAIFGDAVSRAAQSDTSAVPGAAIAALQLGIQLLTAIVYAFTGKDTVSWGGETILDFKQVTDQMGTVYSSGLTRQQGEGNEVVSKPGVQAQTVQSLQQLQQQGGGLLGGATGCLMGAGTEQGSGKGVPQTVGTTGALFQQQFNGGYQSQQRQPSGPVLVPQEFTTQQQCAASQQVSVDRGQLLSQADIDQVKAVPGVSTPKSPTEDPSGAIWGLDANNPNSVLGKLFGGNSSPLPGITGTMFGSPTQPTDNGKVPGGLLSSLFGGTAAPAQVGQQIPSILQSAAAPVTGGLQIPGLTAPSAGASPTQTPAAPKPVISGVGR